MNDQPETVLLGWTRDAGGDAQRFTGEDIYGRAGLWAMDRLRRNIPTISTFYSTVRGLYFASELALVPMASAPALRLRQPDEVTQLAPDFVLLAYKRAEGGRPVSQRPGLHLGSAEQAKSRLCECWMLADRPDRYLPARNADGDHARQDEVQAVAGRRFPDDAGTRLEWHHLNAAGDCPCNGGIPA